MTEERYRIELHGEGSGLLDSITGRSEPDVVRKLIDKLEHADWFFRPGDNLKFVFWNEDYRYVIVKTNTIREPGSPEMTEAFSSSYNCFEGNWTAIRHLSNGVWCKYLDCRKPKLWKTKEGAEKAMATMSDSPKRTILRVRWED